MLAGAAAARAVRRPLSRRCHRPAADRLADALGNDIRSRILESKVTAWRGDAWVRGAYSGASPGQFRQRGVLSQPIDNRLHFAGEATSTEFFATAQGAYLSGERAAIAVAETLGREPNRAECAPPGYGAPGHN